MSLAEVLIARGYLPAELPPPFSSVSYAANLDKLGDDLDTMRPKSSRCVLHSIPRLQHARRFLAIPNPLHQLKLSVLIERCWPELQAHMAQSPLSLTRLKEDSSMRRALSREGDFSDLETERVLRSSCSRFLLKADLSRFYHTLYTHSIPWALHSKAEAKTRRKDKGLFGNLIDEAVRDTQDQQTMGIPVGPDTSDLISEVLGVALDMQLLESNPSLNGLRFVDDYYLYFATRSEAESTLAELHRAANHFSVEINPLKTVIRELPEPLQPSWKAHLRAHVISDEQERQDLLSLFSSAFDSAAKYPGNNVLKYVVKQSTSKTISSENWKL